VGAIKLTSPLVRVLREGHDPLEIQTANPDLVLWDRTRVKHRWPKFDDAPFLWLTFLSWAAARRTGAIEPSYTFERWESEVLEVSNAADDDDAEDDDDELGLPTPPGAGPG
jgi:hypothetical protein